MKLSSMIINNNVKKHQRNNDINGENENEKKNKKMKKRKMKEK